jgi:hypothetical protein
MPIVGAMPTCELPPASTYLAGQRGETPARPGQRDEAPAGPGQRGHSRLLARRAGLVALAAGGFLLPWCVMLGVTLPVTARAEHWSLAWAGLDAAEALAALSTAVLLRRGSPRASLTAVAGAALLLTDAWFDICTSPPGLDRTLAVGEAVCAELPLAGAAIWLAIALTRGGR